MGTYCGESKDLSLSVHCQVLHFFAFYQLRRLSQWDVPEDKFITSWASSSSKFERIKILVSLMGTMVRFPFTKDPFFVQKPQRESFFSWFTFWIGRINSMNESQRRITCIFFLDRPFYFNWNFLQIQCANDKKYKNRTKVPNLNEKCIHFCRNKNIIRQCTRNV